ncbi:DUF6341 family protein [Croceivirga thetidis]|uniref:Uracil phosphoribosyltransferase n=1 Tax=Croceivirga thetidis TaxID=2721623 RepID=A0ABX1GNF1_9FLAO|nr:uracil phosphoribosyltransferase [Croceivirga thetidis]NKI31188.1 uracil phosphoribosyltransferase [Croceivirga thetidis]
MSTFFYGIEDLFVNYLFWPYDTFRAMTNWWTSNSINWIFVIIGAVAFYYWMGQLNIFNKNNEEDKTISSHSYL